MSQLMVSERVIEQASELAAELHGETNLVITREGREQRLPSDLNRILLQIIQSLGAGGAVSVRTLPAELTTTMAAQILDISRPTLMKMIQGRELAARKVGTHFRIKTADVLELQKARIEKQVEALERLREWELDD